MLAAMTSLDAERLTRPPYSLRRAVRERRDLLVCAAFLADGSLGVPFPVRASIVRRLYAASFAIDSPHRQEEVLSFMRAVLKLPRNGPGVVVEAGAYKGSSTAKFSLACALARRELVVFDSFRGMPPNQEPHDRNIFGRPESFKEGAYLGTLEEVRSNVIRFGRIDVCRFVPGWFEDTLPAFDEPVAAAYLDVDLAASTRTCLKYLYPRLKPGGVLFSQDGHLPLVIEVFADPAFWRREVGCEPPRVEGLGKRKLIKIRRD